MSKPLVLSVLALSLVAAAPVRAQDLADRTFRLGANLALGFAGEYDTYASATVAGVRRTAHGEGDANPSIGFDVRGEVPVADFLVIGGWFELLTLQSDVMNAQREATFGIDGYVRARWVFELGDGSFFLEPYVLLPIGFTGAVVDDDDGSGDDLWPGWNTGVFGGAQFLSAMGLGGYLELGWRHGEIYQTFPIAGVDTDWSIVLNELALNVGVVYAFGG